VCDIAFAFLFLISISFVGPVYIESVQKFHENYRATFVSYIRT